MCGDFSQNSITFLFVQYIFILMIHKNIHKGFNQKNKYGSYVDINEFQIQSKPLFHYASMNSIPIITKESKIYKQKKQSNSNKISYISRHASEDQFKRFNSEVNLNCPEKNILYEEDASCYLKKIKSSTGSKDEYKNSIGPKGSKGEIQKQRSKIGINLKETSSTTSAETMIAVKKQIPAFLKCKSKNMLNKRIFDRRFDQEGFKILKKLGEGKFGKVYLAQQLSTGFLLAMKVVEKKKIINEGLLDQFIRELKIQTFLKHPNIIEVYGFFQDDQFFYTLMEFGCDGQLYNLINEKKKLTEEGTSFIAKNLLQAVDYMHKLKILHRDIKPENIVRIMGNVKICDFGWATNKLTKQELRSTYCGTPLYLSPEILHGQKYDQKVDLWAIGILAYELLLGKSPFQIYEQEDLYKIMTDQVRFPSNKKVSKEFEQFIRHILNKNPKQRLSSWELLELKFIKKYEAFETCQQLCE